MKSVYKIVLLSVLFSSSLYCKVLSINNAFIEDFSSMVEKENIRILVPYSKSFYFIDQGQQKGLTYEQGNELSKYINGLYPDNNNVIKITFIPTKRDQLIPKLIAGKGDIIAANLTITDDRKKTVKFINPWIDDISEVLVQNKKTKPIENINDLSGKKVYVRHSSSYFESLKKINKQFKYNNIIPINVIETDEYLEDEDILEMVNAGIYDYTFIDSHVIKIWKSIFTELIFNENVFINDKGHIAWAIREQNTELEKILNTFIKSNKKGTLMGNILFNKYLKSGNYINNAKFNNEQKNFQEIIKYIKHYSNQYDFDWLIITALGYQESGLDHNTVSQDGAIGLMQILKSTASDKNVDIENIHELENNIHAGIKYLKFIHQRYFSSSDMDELNQWLFTFAAYNAGPAKVRSLRKKAIELGLNPNIWFSNVEVAASIIIGRETVQYVSNIYKYYIAYSTSLNMLNDKKKHTDLDN